MLKNYFKIAFRNILKQKSFSIINIVGLAIGISSCILILLFVQDELSYDKFFENSERIYRVRTEGIIGDRENRMAVSPGPLAYTMLREFPEVEAVTRIRSYGFPVFRYEDKAFSEERVYWADSTFFDVFKCKFIEGSPETALKTNDAIVLTKSMAKKYFGNQPALGKTINSDRRNDYRVTAIIEDFPKNSHFRPDFLESLAPNLNPRGGDSRWVSNNFYTYVVLKEGTNLNGFQDKLDGLVIKYAAPEIESFTGQSYEKLVKQGNSYKFLYQKMTDIHLHSNYEFEIGPNSDATYVYIFSIIAFSILLIACFNFMNLSTARSTNRAREVGIRKTLGSTKSKLIAQFLTESIIISLFSVVVALIIIQLILPSFNNIAGKNLELSLFNNFVTLPSVLLFGICVGILAGIYPAFVLTSFMPVDVLRGDKQMKGKRSWLRNGLVVSQFSVSVILFIGTIIVGSQLDYIQNKKLGYDKDKLLIIEKTDDLAARFQDFKKELLRNPSILNVANHHTIPGRTFGNNVYQLENDESNGNYSMMMWFADFDLLDTYKLEMARGRFFEEEHPSDSNGVVINESAAKMLGLQDPIGKRLVTRFNNNTQFIPIVGVMKDFHFESMHTAVRPLVILPMRFNGRVTAVRIAGGNISETISQIEKIWKEYAFDQAFEYVFMDDEFNRIYATEKRIGSLFTSFSILAVLIACLGLFGLAAFITVQKTKEIGIRKVMGASIGGILLLLVKEFTKWVIIANLVAWPVSYWAMNNWLNGFAYRIDVSLFVFILAGLGSLFVALLTVSSQVIKAASQNPAVSLRSN